MITDHKIDDTYLLLCETRKSGQRRWWIENTESGAWEKLTEVGARLGLARSSMVERAEKFVAGEFPAELLLKPKGAIKCGHGAIRTNEKLGFKPRRKQPKAHPQELIGPVLEGLNPLALQIAQRGIL